MPVQICRVCFEEGTDLKILGSGLNSSGYKLASCVPEINVYIVENPTICKPCLCMVEVAFKLRETCLENEKRFNPNFDRNDFVFTKRTQIKRQLGEGPEKEQQGDGKEVSVVFNDYFDQSELVNIDIDTKDILVPKQEPDAGKGDPFVGVQPVTFNNTNDVRNLNQGGTFPTIPEIKTEVIDPSENLLMISAEYITTESNDTFISRVSSEGMHEYTCNMCDKTFSGSRGLKAHVNKMHNKTSVNKTKFVCEFCRRVFAAKGALSTHSKTCSKKPGDNLIDSSALSMMPEIAVIKTEPGGDNNNFNESLPPVSDGEGLNETINASNEEHLNSDTFTCEKCLKIFTTRASFRFHSKRCKEIFMENIETKMEGGLCVNPISMMGSSSIANKYDGLDSHSDNNEEADSDFDPSYVSSSESVDIESDGSDFSISNRRKRKPRRNFRNLSDDLLTKRKRIDLQVKCDNCQRTFSTRAAYTIHSKSCKMRLSLTKVDPTGDATSRDVEMVEIVNQNPDGVTASEKLARKDYINVESDNESINVDDPIHVSAGAENMNSERKGMLDAAETTSGEFVCKICEAKFAEKQTLEEHVNTHIGESAPSTEQPKPKSAQDDDEITVCCGKEYTTVSLLQLHTYKEHGKSCGVCNKHYTSYNELFAHLLEHTKE